MNFEAHCLECKAHLGDPFTAVHRWLDEFMGSKEYGMRHRKVRHHEEGIKKVVELFGKEAGLAARMHIIADLKEEGWKEGDHFPLNETDYVKMGLF